MGLSYQTLGPMDPKMKKISIDELSLHFHRNLPLNYYLFNNLLLIIRTINVKFYIPYLSEIMLMTESD